MPGLLAPLLARFRREASAPQQSATMSPAETRLAARSLADGIERAMDLGLWEHADRIARSAMRLAPGSSRLSERLARLRLAQGAPEAALGVIEACHETTASLRLLRAVCRIDLGHPQPAHSDLLSWSKRSSAPLDARVILALLEWNLGDEHAATNALLRNLRHLEDPRSLELLVLLATKQGRRGQSAAWAARLRECARFGRGSAFTEVLLCSLGLPPDPSRAAPSEAHVEQLALELVTAEQVIPPLVEAQRRRFDADVADLLYRAILRARGELVDHVQALDALARLALLLDDRAAAERWLREGLELNPMSASLRMLERELEETAADGHFAPDAPYERRDVIATIGGAATTADPREEAA
jgi:hypothetical protein